MTRRVWRSWFSNTCVLIGFLAMAAICTAVAAVNAVGHGTGGRITTVIFALMAAPCWWVAVRAPRMGILATDSKVIVRDMWRTTIVPWDEIIGVVGHRVDQRAIGGPDAGIIRRGPSGKRERRVSLKVVATYGLINRGGMSLSDRAVAELQELLAAHRRR